MKRYLGRYLVFKGDNYYPSGGWEDFAGSADTVDAAREIAGRHEEWWHVVDSKNGTIILDGWGDVVLDDSKNGPAAR